MQRSTVRRCAAVVGALLLNIPSAIAPRQVDVHGEMAGVKWSGMHSRTVPQFWEHYTPVQHDPGAGAKTCKH